MKPTIRRGSMTRRSTSLLSVAAATGMLVVGATVVIAVAWKPGQVVVRTVDGAELAVNRADLGVIDDVRKCVTMDLKDPREGRLAIPSRRGRQPHRDYSHDRQQGRREEAHPDSAPRSAISINFGEDVAEDIGDRKE